MTYPNKNAKKNKIKIIAKKFGISDYLSIFASTN